MQLCRLVPDPKGMEMKTREVWISRSRGPGGSGVLPTLVWDPTAKPGTLVDR